MNILVIQNRMGIGDMVIFLPFIEAISKKYNSPITLLIKESTKAKEYTKNLNSLENYYENGVGVHIPKVLSAYLSFDLIEIKK